MKQARNDLMAFVRYNKTKSYLIDLLRGWLVLHFLRALLTQNTIDHPPRFLVQSVKEFSLLQRQLKEASLDTS